MAAGLIRPAESRCRVVDHRMASRSVAYSLLVTNFSGQARGPGSMSRGPAYAASI
jgi:hypothetical protein